MHIDDNLRHGMSPPEARRQALIAMGGIEAIKEGYRDQRTVRWLHDLFQDVRYGIRALRQAPYFTMVVVLTLALGVGANTVMFGIVDQMLLQAPAGIGHPHALRRVYFSSDMPTSPGGRVVAQTNSYPVVAAIREGLSAFATTAAMYRTEISLGVGGDARLAVIELVSPDYFALLELRPAVGRFFTRGDNAPPDISPVAILSHSFWTREFAGDQNAIGQHLQVEGRLLTIIGVAPRGFSGTDWRPVDFWAPVDALGRELLGSRWESHYGTFVFGLIARLADDATEQRANAQATAAYRRTLATADLPPFMRDLPATAFAVPLNGLHAPTGIAPEGRVGVWLWGVSIVVLLVATANVAQLLLTRTFARRAEMQVRLALGATHSRIVRQLLAESTLLVTLATIAALSVAVVASHVMQQLLLPGFTWQDRVIDGRMLAVTLAFSAILAVVTGLTPGLYGLCSGSTLRPLRLSSGRTGLLRTGLLVAQVSLSVLLLVGAGLFAKSLHAVRAYDVGIDLDRVIQASLPQQTGASVAAAEAAYASGLERLEVIPGVERVAMMHRSMPVSIREERLREDDTGDRPVPWLSVVTPDYFATLGATIERGRDLTHGDERLARRVAVINRALATEYWPQAEPLGQCVQLGSDANCTEIVGVVENILLSDRTDTAQGRLFVPTSHPFGAGRPTRILVRTNGDARPIVPMVRSALQTLTPDMPFVAVDTMERVTSHQIRPWRLGTTMFLVFGFTALLIATVGLYSTMAHAVAQRTHEIGVRMALGARPWSVIALIGAQSAGTVAGGIAIGLLLAAGVTRWLIDLLYDTSPHDPMVFASVALVLLVAGVIASIVPIARSTRVNPIDALRED